MFKKTLAVVLASFLVTSISSAAVLDEDNVTVLSTSTAASGKLKDWSLTFFSIASVDNMKPNKTAKTGRSVESYDYLSINYKADFDSRYSLRLPFRNNTAGSNAYGDEVSSEVVLQDIHFVYSNYDLGYIGDVDLSGKVKVYLPTSSASQDQKMITKIRFEGYADYQIARKFSVAYVVKPDIYWQTQTVSVNSSVAMDEDGYYERDPISANKQFALEHYAQFQYDINSMFSLATKTGFKEDWDHGSAANRNTYGDSIEPDHSTALRLGLDFWIRPVRGLSFTLGISNQTYLNSNRGEDVAIGRPENTKYSLMTNATLF